MGTDYERAKTARMIEEQFYKKMSRALKEKKSIMLDVGKNHFKIGVRNIEVENGDEGYIFWKKNLQNTITYTEFLNIFPLSKMMSVDLTTSLHLNRWKICIKMFHDYPYLGMLKENMEQVNVEIFEEWRKNIRNKGHTIVIGVSTSGWFPHYGVITHDPDFNHYILLYDIAGDKFIAYPDEMLKIINLIQENVRIEKELREKFYGIPKAEIEKTDAIVTQMYLPSQPVVAPHPPQEQQAPLRETTNQRQEQISNIQKKVEELVRDGTIECWKEFIKTSLSSRTKITFPPLDEINAKMGYGAFFNLLFLDHEIVSLLNSILNSPDQKIRSLIKGDEFVVRGLRVFCELLLKKSVEFNMSSETEWQYLEYVLNMLANKSEKNIWQLNVRNETTTVTRETIKEKRGCVRYQVS